VLAAQHLLAVGRSVDEAPSAAVALQVLAPELPSLGVRRLAMVVPDPHGGGAQPIVFAYEDGRVLTPAEAAAGAPAVESVAGTVRRGVRTDPVVVRALVAAGDAVGLLVYEPARTGASDLPQPWSPGAFPDDLAARLARALGRDVVRERLGTLRQGLTAASERLEAETARRVAAEEDLRRATRELSRSLTVDPLTGIHNRASLDDALEREWQAHAVSRRPLGVLMVDVDHFKAYNDRYGHVQGDVILREIARRLREAARRTSDLAARYGGEEFTVVLPDTDVTGARLVADTLLTRVREAAIAHEDVPGGRLTVSVGIAVWQVPSDWGPGDLIRAADEALYRAKADGRDRLAVAGSTAPGDSLALPMSGAMAVARRRAAPRH
jgi:diguanylate cyclase (GGDEF)-like protein